MKKITYIFQENSRALLIIAIISIVPIVLFIINNYLQSQFLQSVIELFGIWVVPILLLDWELCGWLEPGILSSDFCSQIDPLLENLVPLFIFTGNFIVGCLLWFGGRKIVSFLKKR